MASTGRTWCGSCAMPSRSRASWRSWSGPPKPPWPGTSIARASSPTSASPAAWPCGSRTATALETIARDSGVPAQYLVAITGVETFYGRQTGGYRVLDALATLAFDYPRRAEYFQQRADAVPAAHARGAASIRASRKAPMPARWAFRSSCPPACAATRWMAAATAIATCGSTARMSSPAWRTTSRSMAGDAGEPVLAEASHAESPDDPAEGRGKLARNRRRA